jgi:alpha-L-fucosidase
VWHVDGHGHDAAAWKPALYYFAQKVFQSSNAGARAASDQAHLATTAASDIAAPPPLKDRVPREEMGVSQLDNAELNWMLDGKIGLFIHWGLYAGPGRGEWAMYNEAIPADRYRRLAYPEAGDEYFDAAKYDPRQWAQLAKDAGMRWMCLTARHHDGFCLFDSPHPNAFTSVQTLRRDLIKEYTDACRAAGLKVGLYYSPLSWRYPGYYDVTGRDCAKNNFGFTTDPSHLENARLMKEENYVNVKQLLTQYGQLDHIFWDGGWLAQQGSDADAAFFHEPGRFLDPRNRWPISQAYRDIDPATGRALGIMGMVRRYQPHAITNLRYGWIGDVIEEEGDYETTGPIRSAWIQNKNLSMQHGGWGYNAKAVAEGAIMTRDELVRFLANCLTRNMTLLINVGPDRHGVIPGLEQQRLRELGAWIARMSESVYGTRGGPWQPTDKKFGYCFKGSIVYAHILKDQEGAEFRFPPLGALRAERVYDVWSGTDLPFERQSDGSMTVRRIDRETSPADTVVAVRYDRPVADVWK